MPLDTHVAQSRCLKCRYSLSGISAACCPECGYVNNQSSNSIGSRQHSACAFAIKSKTLLVVAIVLLPSIAVSATLARSLYPSLAALDVISELIIVSGLTVILLLFIRSIKYSSVARVALLMLPIVFKIVVYCLIASVHMINQRDFSLDSLGYWRVAFWVSMFLYSLSPVITMVSFEALTMLLPYSYRRGWPLESRWFLAIATSTACLLLLACLAPVWAYVVSFVDLGLSIILSTLWLRQVGCWTLE